MKRELPFSFMLPTAFFLIDQLTKIWVRKNFALGETKNVLPFLDFTYITNTGTAFGLAGGFNYIFIGASIIIICVMVFFKSKIFYPSNLSLVSYSLIMGGAFGNLLDRFAFGSVIDFIDFRFWPVFNMADSFITVGACIFLFEANFLRKSGGR